MIWSEDDHSKASLGKTAFSKHIHSNKFFVIGKEPETPDKDFPLHSRLLVTPSVYLEL
jgi:hypothetical protein